VISMSLFHSSQHWTDTYIIRGFFHRSTSRIYFRLTSRINVQTICRFYYDYIHYITAALDTSYIPLFVQRLLIYIYSPFVSDVSCICCSLLAATSLLHLMRLPFFLCFTLVAYVAGCCSPFSLLTVKNYHSWPLLLCQVTLISLPLLRQELSRSH
jgi:hypothetical protein